MNSLRYVLWFSFFLVQGISHAQTADQLTDELIKVKAHLHPVLVDQAKQILARKIVASVTGQAVNRLESLKNGFSLISAKDSTGKVQKYLLRESDNAVFRVISSKISRPDMIRSYGYIASGISAIEIMVAGKTQPAILNFADLSVYGLSVFQEAVKVDSIVEPKVESRPKICITFSIGGSGGVFRGSGPGLSNMSMGGSGFINSKMSGVFTSGGGSNCR